MPAFRDSGTPDPDGALSLEHATFVFVASRPSVKMTPADQLDFAFGADSRAEAAPTGEVCVLPQFTFTDASTPRQIWDWWTALVEVYEPLKAAARRLEEEYEREMTALKGRRDLDAVARRARAKSASRDAAERAAEVELQVNDAFSTAQAAYHDRIFALVKEAHGVDLSPDDRSDYLEMFWDCLQRPLIESDYDTTLETFVRVVFAPAIEDSATADSSAEEAAATPS